MVSAQVQQGGMACRGCSAARGAWASEVQTRCLVVRPAWGHRKLTRFTTGGRHRRSPGASS